MPCAKIDWNGLSGSGEENFFYFVNVFSPFRNYLPFERRGALYLNKIESPHPRMLCAKFGWNWFNGSGEKDFLISSIYFCYFKIFPPWKRAGPFFWTNLNPLHPWMLCAKFGRNFFKNFVNVFSPICNYLPFEKGGDYYFIWTKLNPLTQGCFVLSLVEIGSVVLEKKIF